MQPRLDGGAPGDATRFRGRSRLPSVDGGIVVKALLVSGAVVGRLGRGPTGGDGAAGAGVPGQFVAITLAIWNPYVAERLLQGHWSLLVGYGCLPWVAAAMLTLRSAGDLAGPGCSAWLLDHVGRTDSDRAELAATVALVCVAAPRAGRSRWLCAATALGAALVTALPWLTASAVGSSLTGRAAPGVDAFAPRAEPGLGTLGAWQASAGFGTPTPYLIPDNTFRSGPPPRAPGCGGGRLADGGRRPAVIPLLVLAAVAVLVPAGWRPAPASIC